MINTNSLVCSWCSKWAFHYLREALRGNHIASEEVHPLAYWEVHLSGSSSFLYNWSHHDFGAEHELVVNVQVCVVQFEHQRSGDWNTS